MMIWEQLAMRFNELAQSAEEDNFNKWDIDDTRRPRLTLKHLNKMRNRRELARAEHTSKVEDVQLQYGASQDAEQINNIIISYNTANIAQ